jgi:integrase
MKRPPRYCHHKSSGQAYLTIRGRQVFLGKFGTPESIQRYQQEIAGLAADTAPAPVDVSIAELIERYWLHVRTYYVKGGKPTSEHHCIKSALKPLLELHSLTPASEADQRMVKQVRQRMIEAGWSRTTINQHVKRIGRMFHWAADCGHVDAAVYQRVACVQSLRKGRTEVRETDPVKPVPDAHVDAILPHVADSLSTMIRLQRLTGMRPAEVCAMRGCDLDTTGKVWTYTPGTHKTEHHGHDRVVHLGPQAQDLIRPLLRHDLTAHLFSPRREAAASLKHGDRSKRGLRLEDRQRPPRDAYTPDSYRRAIGRACRLAGVPHWAPNQLRHAAATRVRREFGLDGAQVILGHSQARITQLYAAVDNERAREIALKVG